MQSAETAITKAGIADLLNILNIMMKFLNGKRSPAMGQRNGCYYSFKMTSLK
jgi:hypothetical protein